MKSSAEINATRNGVMAAAVAFATWGLYPIFYKQLQEIGSLEIVAHRVLWSFGFLAIGVFLLRGPGALRGSLNSPRSAAMALLAAVIISANWLIFIYAVSTNRILEASLGYFLNPVISALIGRIVLGERQNGLQVAAIVVAACGMILTFVVAGVVPWLSLAMAFSFAFYSLIRKQSELDSATGLFYETLVMVPAACVFIYLGDAQIVGHGPRLTFWLIASGALTLIPLLTVVYAARRIELGTLGFFQYIAPVMHFIIAIFIYHEPLDLARLMAFITTILAVILFVSGVIWSRRQRRHT